MDCISRTGTGTLLDRSVSIELLLGLYRITRTGTGAVMDSIVSVGLGTIVDCRVSVGALVDCIISIRLVLGQTGTAYYQ